MKHKVEVPRPEVLAPQYSDFRGKLEAYCGSRYKTEGKRDSACRDMATVAPMLAWRIGPHDGPMRVLQTGAADHKCHALPLTVRGLSRHYRAATHLSNWRFQSICRPASCWMTRKLPPLVRCYPLRIDPELI
jgi:hypothetical protein